MRLPTCARPATGAIDVPPHQLTDAGQGAERDDGAQARIDKCTREGIGDAPGARGSHVLQRAKERHVRGGAAGFALTHADQSLDVS